MSPQAGALIATDGDYGISLAADGALASLSYNVVIRQVWSGDERLRKEKSDGFARDFLPREGIDFVERTATQLNFSSYYSFDAGPRLGFRALWQRNKRDETYAIGPSLFQRRRRQEWPIAGHSARGSEIGDRDKSEFRARACALFVATCIIREYHRINVELLGARVAAVFNNGCVLARKSRHLIFSMPRS